MDIREFLFRKNMSRRELSEVLGVCYHTISNWQKGTRAPRLSQAKKLIEYSKGLITLDDLYGKRLGTKVESDGLN